MKSNKIFVFVVMLVLVITSSDYLVSGYGGPPEQTSANNYTVKINTNHESYNLGESLIFSGSVNKYDEDRNLRISIFDSSNNLIVTQKTLVEDNGRFSHNLTLDENFLSGKYIVKAQYGNSKATVESISFLINYSDMSSIAESSDQKIPDWIKINAGWWASNQIDDSSFVEGIQFLIKEGLIKISN